MSLIEQAAKRLEELRRAGAESAGDGPGARIGAEGERVVADTLPTPEAAVHELAARAGAAGPFLARAGQHDPAAPATAPRPAAVAARDVPRLEINLERLKERGFVTPDAPKSQIADEFRIIKRPIIGNAFGRTGARVRDGNLVMVTSALPGEGKTFTAVNLAMSLAMELDNTVLLVDGDVAHPDLPKTLGVRNSPGLLDLLTDENPNIEDAIVRTNIETLSVLPAGAHHRRATELLASEQMAMLLRQLTMRYPDRMIIFDSPPLLATTESRVLASHMGQIVMVVAADSTRQHAVNLALSTIENCEVVLMMLNKAEKTDVGAYYGYYANDAPR